MKRIYICFSLAFLLSFSYLSSAQVAAYTFSASSGTYTPITGTSPTMTGDGTNPIPDEGIANGIPIGFSFTFSGAPYTTIGASTNGFISFGAALTTWGFTNNLSAGPAGSESARPLAAPLWDDHDIQATTNLQYTTTGSSPNRVFTIQWSNVKWNWNATAAGMEFQVKLYETTNVVEFVYNQLAGALNSASASIGLAATGTGSGNFLSLNNATASPTASSTVNTGTISAKPATGQVYRFTPPSCSAPGGLVANNVTHNSADLSWAAVPGSSGYEYAVTTSATPPASGTGTLFTAYNATGLNPVTQYWLHVRTDCSGPFSGWATISFTTSFDCSVAESISGCGISKTASLSGAGVYNITSCGFNTPGNEKLYSFTAPSNGNYTLNITAANGNYIDYFYKAVSGGCGTTGWTCIDDNNAIGTDVFGPLTAGVTYYLLLDAEDNTVTSNVTFQLDCPAAVPPLCTTLTSPANGATNVVMPPVLTWAAAPGATNYNVYFGTVNPPTTLLGNTAATTATINGTVGGTTYYWYIAPANTAGEATGCSSGTFSFTTEAAPANDLVCNAIALTLGGPQDCKNTAAASATGDPALTCSAPNNTVWYSYTPAATGVVVLNLEIPGAATNPLNGWVAWYTATGTCPAPGLTLTQVGDCTEFGQTGAGDIDLISSPVLTGGTTYYIMIDGFSGDVGEFCINAVAPPPPPSCTTNLTPANGATGITVSPSTTLTWNAAPGATSYDVYFGTVNPPTTLIGNTTATTVNVTGLSYNTTYYWYVAPRNGGGAATGCDASTTSFTTENPTNCTPIYTTGCTLADSLTYFSLKGASGTVIHNQSGATCNTTPVAYSDYTAAFAPVTLVRGESFGGFMRTGDDNDYATIWIDGNDNGFFEDNERVMNNLKIGTAMKLYTLYVPTTTPLGTHRLRVRVIWSSTAPTAITHPCNPYSYGETEDYMVNVTNVGSAHNVATGTPGSCMTAGAITIDAASNNNGSAPVFLVDSLNNYIAAIYPNGNNLGPVNTSYYVHNGPVRQTVDGRYYINRNVTLTPATAPTGPYNLRYFFLTSELNALIAQPGSGVTSIFDLTMTKTRTDICLPIYDGFLPSSHVPTGFGSLLGDRFLDFTGLTSFSNHWLHGGLGLLPTNLLSFAGQKEGSVNKLRWTTATEQNNNGFDVQRSTDGVNYNSIGFVTSLAPGGNSTANTNYTFVDNAPSGSKQYYRLRQLDLNGNARMSSIVLIKGDKPMTLTIAGLFPNPAQSQVNVLLDAPSKDKVTLVVIDAAGRSVIQQSVNLETGSNTIPVDISKLTNGTYMVKLVCNSNCETALAKFVKQ